MMMCENKLAYLYDILQQGVPFRGNICYNMVATQVDIILITGEYSGKKCFLSLLIPVTGMRLCGNNERSHSFTSASLIAAHFFIVLKYTDGGLAIWRTLKKLPLV